MIPLITKFKSNVVLYDATGESSSSYRAVTYSKDYIYFLKDELGTIVRYDTITEELSTFPSLIYSPISHGDYEEYEPPNSILQYGDSIYSFEGYDAKKFYGESVMYIKGNNQLVQESFDRKTKITHLSSITKIKDFFIDEDYNYYVMHSENRVSKFTKERILLYSVQIKSSTNNVFYTSLSVLPTDYVELIKMDYVREYTDNGLLEYPIFLGRTYKSGQESSNKEMFLAKYDETNQTVISAVYIGLSSQGYIPHTDNRLNYNLTNYDFLKNTYPNKDEIVFKLKLQNVYNNEDVVDIEIPVSIEGFTSESHHFAFRLDGINGKVCVFLDGDLIQEVEISSGQYIFQDLFTESFNIGNTYFHNSKSLDNYLKQPAYYYINNSSVSNFKMYKKALSDNEILFHVFGGINMDDLVVSLPCDQRSEIESIERQFKLDSSGNKSNKINIIIKNSQLTNTNLQTELKDILTDKLKKVLPITTTINNIEFR